MMNKSLRFHTNEKEECAFAFLSVRSSLLFLGFFHCNFTVFINPFIKLSGFRILFDNAVNDFQYIITSLWQCNSRDFLSSLELYIRQSKVIIEYKVLLGNDAFHDNSVKFAILQLQDSIRDTGKSDDVCSFD